MDDAPGGTSVVSADAELRIGGRQLKLRLVVPADEVPPEALLPTLHQLSNTVVDGVEQKAQRHGAAISCRKGCGACCRQLVPISPAEARLLAQIVDAMPAEARAGVLERFEAAVQRLEASGLLDRAMNYHLLPEEEVKAIVHDYFHLRIACPFLEDEACSIHPYRPLICREYLVISPAEHCATLAEDEIRRLQFPVSVAGTFAELEGVAQPGENPYLPLVMALRWAEAHADEVELRPGPEWVQAFFRGLTGTEVPGPAIPGRAVEFSDSPI